MPPKNGLFCLLTKNPLLQNNKHYVKYCLMIAQVIPHRFYYSVQVFCPDSKGNFHWENFDTYKYQYLAREMMSYLHTLPVMSLRELYKFIS